MFESLKTIDRFEDKFSNPEILKSEDFEGKIKVIDLEPDTPKSETPLLIVPGWAATAEVHKDNAIEFAKRGRRTIAISAPHGVEVSPENEDMPLAELRKAQSVLEVLNQKGIERADVVTHSEAALFVTAVALQNPERFRTIVYNAPAGLIGEDSFWQLAQRFSTDILTQVKNTLTGRAKFSKVNTVFTEALKTILAGPQKSLDEVKAIASIQIQESLKQLREKGVKVIIVHPVNDKAFPMERMQQMLKKEMVDGFVSTGDPKQTGKISDTHNSWYLSPEKYSAAVDSLLDTVEKNEKKPT